MRGLDGTCLPAALRCPPAPQALSQHQPRANLTIPESTDDVGKEGSKAEKIPITQGGRCGCILGPKPSKPGPHGAQRQLERLVWVGWLRSHSSLGDLIYTVNRSQSTGTSRESTIWRSTHEQARGEKRNDSLPSQRARKQPSVSQSWGPSTAAALQPGWGWEVCGHTHRHTDTQDTDTHRYTYIQIHKTQTNTDTHRYTHRRTHGHTRHRHIQGHRHMHTQTQTDTQTHTQTHAHTQTHTQETCVALQAGPCRGYTSRPSSASPTPHDCFPP